ncbi:tRNA1(Val) (adenine(37)-N6)-methyltransferase [Bacillaceae bacterium Marseille-Q3522]|nr:tRNA1(Val) (adenine(37)-N6)-methyltransferase [Bacillaceae bacterium Marseille-Q3522]
MVTLIGDERLDDLLAEKLKIIQSPSVFAFSLDAALLAKFVYVPIQKGKLVDLCSGNGVIPLFLSSRTKGMIIGVEIQERLADMAVRSFMYNGLADRLQMICADLKGISQTIGSGQYDVVTCNPPYFVTPSEGDINKNEHLAIARHELYCTLEDTVKEASRLLKQGGKAAFVHRPGRLLDILTFMRTYQLEPKRLQFIYPKPGREANTILVEAIKGGKKDLKILPPLVVYTENGEYTKEIRAILYGE